MSIQRQLGLDRDSGCVVIAEVAQAHDGSLGLAHAHIDAAAEAGADIVKFQTHIASAESTLAEPWRVKFSRQDETRYDYWRRMEFTKEQWVGLREHARECGLQFLSTPFSPEAVKLLDEVGVAGWKVASGEVTNAPMLQQMGETGVPILLSTGMSSWNEIDAAVATIRATGAPLVVFQCTTSYPTPPDQIGLNVLQELGSRYDVPVGLSDHSANSAVPVAAVALGAELVEAHITLSRSMYGPDVCASLTTDEFKSAVAGIRSVEAALSNPVDKDAIAEELSPLRLTFGKSAVAGRDLHAGTIITEQDIAYKKPGWGLHPKDVETILGRALNREVKSDEILSEEMFH